MSVTTKHYQLSVLRFGYLFGVIAVFLKPYKGFDLKRDNCQVGDNKVLYLLAITYLICGFISLYYTLPKAIAISQMGDWNQLRQDIYSETSSITLYDSQFEKLAKNIYSYFAPFGSVYTFYLLTKPKFNKLLVTLLLVVWMANCYASSVLIASRGALVMAVMEVLVLFVTFRKMMPALIKKILYAFVGIVLVFFISFSISVSVSRFGNNSDNSILEYFGHSMLAFNDGVMRTIESYGCGRYQCGWILKPLGVDTKLNFAKMGCTHDTSFMTFVGNLYIDFGPILTVLIGLVFMALMTNKIKKNTYRLSDIILIIYFASWLIKGVFAFGADQSLQWFMAFVVYLIIRRVESPPPSNKKA